MVTAVQKHYYGYGSVIDVRESFRDSCVLGPEEKGRIRVGSTICLCILRVRISGCISGEC
jgi:hypothetical protein